MNKIPAGCREEGVCPSVQVLNRKLSQAMEMVRQSKACTHAEDSAEEVTSDLEENGGKRKEEMKT